MKARPARVKAMPSRKGGQPSMPVVGRMKGPLAKPRESRLA